MPYPLGILGLSYGLAQTEPSQQNKLLAEEIERLREAYEAMGREVIVVAQWEIALALPHYHGVVPPRLDGYLDSEDVMDAAGPVFAWHGVHEVMVVANPFLHLPAARRSLAQRYNHVPKQPIRPIGHNRLSLQWWTRSCWQLMAYAVLKQFGYRGRLIVTDQMRELMRRNALPTSR